MNRSKKTVIGESRQEQLLAWAQEAMASSGVRNVDFARAAGLSEDQVSKTLAGSRQLQEHEVQILASLTRTPVPPLQGFPSPAITGRVEAVMAVQWAHPTVIIAPGLWRDAGAVIKMTEQIPLSPDPRLAGLKQYVCKIEGETSYLNCADLDGSKPRAGSVVHVRRFKGEQYEDTLWQVEFSDGELRLTMEGAAPLSVQAPPSDVVIHGVVVGRYIPTNF